MARGLLPTGTDRPLWVSHDRCLASVGSATGGMGDIGARSDSYSQVVATTIHLFRFRPKTTTTRYCAALREASVVLNRVNEPSLKVAERECCILSTYDFDPLPEAFLARLAMPSQRIPAVSEDFPVRRKQASQSLGCALTSRGRAVSFRAVGETRRHTHAYCSHTQAPLHLYVFRRETICVHQHTRSSAMRIVGALGVALAGLSMTVAVAAYGQTDTRSPFKGMTAAVVDGKGNMHVPTDYRTTYQTLGSWAVAADNGPGSKQLHVVYASP